MQQTIASKILKKFGNNYNRIEKMARRIMLMRTVQYSKNRITYIFSDNSYIRLGLINRNTAGA
jgi:hypothetical protein